MAGHSDGTLSSGVPVVGSGIYVDRLLLVPFAVVSPRGCAIARPHALLRLEFHN